MVASMQNPPFVDVPMTSTEDFTTMDYIQEAASVSRMPRSVSDGSAARCEEKPNSRNYTFTELDAYKTV